MQSPCRDCVHINGNKSLPVCMQCEKRVAYVRSMGSDVDMQPMVNSSSGYGGKSVAGGADYDAGKDNEKMADTPETKICTKPDCKHAGESQPVSNFYKGASMCKDCFRAYQASKKSGTVPARKMPSGPATKPDGKRLLIVLDFTDQPEIYSRLAEREAINIITAAIG